MVGLVGLEGEWKRELQLHLEMMKFQFLDYLKKLQKLLEQLVSCYI